MNIPLLLTEASAIGILTIILGYVVIFLMDKLNIKLGKQLQMIIGFFVLGATIHLFCEFTGVNKWYCKNGHACLTK